MNEHKESPISRYKVRTVLLLIVVYVITFVPELNWVWGIFFLIWVVPSILSGSVYIIEPIDRSEHKLLYWIVVGTWVWMSVYMILSSFIPWLRWS